MGAPLRGAALGEVDVVEDAFVLCEEGRITQVGRMRDLGPLDGDAEEVDGRGLCAIPGLVDCHTHVCFAGDRVAEFDLRARGASYEELHAAGGGILSTVRATRAAGEDGPRATRFDAIARGCCMRARRRSRESRATGSIATPSSRHCARSAPRVVFATWLGAHAVPPEYDDADSYLDFAIAEVLPDAARIAEAADVFVERGAFSVEQARRYLEACRDAGLALRLHGDQFSEQGAIGLAVELGARSVDHLEATGDDGIRRLAASEVVGVVLPVAALVLGRPMPRAREFVDSGGAIALATDFNPGSAFCESLPLVCSLACTQLGLPPAEVLAAVTVNAAHVLRRADRSAG